MKHHTNYQKQVAAAAIEHARRSIGVLSDEKPKAKKLGEIPADDAWFEEKKTDIGRNLGVYFR